MEPQRASQDKALVAPDIQVQAAQLALCALQEPAQNEHEVQRYVGPENDQEKSSLDFLLEEAERERDATHLPVVLDAKPTLQEQHMDAEVPEKKAVPGTGRKKKTANLPYGLTMSGPSTSKQWTGNLGPYAKTEKAKELNRKVMQRLRETGQSIIKKRVLNHLDRRNKRWRRSGGVEEFCRQAIYGKYKDFIAEMELKSTEEQKEVKIPVWPNY